MGKTKKETKGMRERKRERERERERRGNADRETCKAARGRGP